MDTVESEPTWPIDMAAWIRRGRFVRARSPQVVLAAMVAVLRENGCPANLVQRKASYESRLIPRNERVFWAVAGDCLANFITLEGQTSWEAVESDFRAQVFRPGTGNFHFMTLHVSHLSDTLNFLANMDPDHKLLHRVRKVYLDVQAKAIADATPKTKRPGWRARL